MDNCVLIGVLRGFFDIVGYTDEYNNKYGVFFENK